MSMDETVQGLDSDINKGGSMDVPPQQDYIYVKGKRSRAQPDYQRRSQSQLHKYVDKGVEPPTTSEHGNSDLTKKNLSLDLCKLHGGQGG